ncbi:TaqI-like C-terminal specificity domain-containing protein [Flavobacterium sp. CS20]|uniref:TaqI-like C-terminal specificity domain-containing protein n=1 Tax=Flavobacterium sp. CS20 TaxID=2775246 RepID=UPI001B3A11C8|nr:TaqI-like C-terminal specificity domain-containing protein [Flavobacterium sp. CS20]QTY28162.1 hypothetical protein IGB25_06665 [Flavobacterium sp. CS20]
MKYMDILKLLWIKGVYPIIILGNAKKDSTNTSFVEYYLNHFSDLKYGVFKKVKQMPNYKSLVDSGVKISSGATGFQAQQLKKNVIEERLLGSIPFTVSGNVDRYKFNNEDVQFMKRRYSEAYVTKTPDLAESKWSFWNKPKIVIAGMTKVVEAVYTTKPLGLGVGVYGIYDFGEFEPYALTAILNSRYLSYYFRNKFKDKHLAGGYLAINKSTIESFPIVEVNFDKQSILTKLSRYLHWIIGVEKQKSYGKNKVSEIERLIEGIIDAIIYELYLPELSQKHNCTIIEHLGELPKFTESMSNTQKEEIITTVFYRLNNKHHQLYKSLNKLKEIDEIAIIEGLKD